MIVSRIHEAEEIKPCPHLTYVIILSYGIVAVFEVSFTYDSGCIGRKSKIFR